MWQTLALSTISGIWLLLAVGMTPFRASAYWPRIQCDVCTAHAGISYAQPVSSTVQTTGTVSSTTTTEPVTYADLLETQRDVLETSRHATDSLQTLFIASGLIGVFGVLVGGGWLLFRNYTTIKEVSTISADAEQKLLDMKRQIDAFKLEVDERIRQTEELRQAHERLRKQFDEQAKTVDDVRKQIKMAQHDIQDKLPRLEILASVDTYAMKLFSANQREQQNALSKLLQYIQDDDPVVRRECIRVFGAMPEYPEIFELQDRGIRNRLHILALTDKERGVQLEARAALKNFGVDLDQEKPAA